MLTKIRSRNILSDDGLSKLISESLSGSEFSPFNPFPNRAAFIGADILPQITEHSWLTPSGQIIRVKRDESGNIGPTADGGMWSYIGQLHPDHNLENTTPGTTDMDSAISAAVAIDNVELLPAEYAAVNMIPLVDNRSIKGVQGSGVTRLAGEWSGSQYLFTQASDITFSDFTINLEADANTGVGGSWVQRVASTEYDIVYDNMVLDGGTTLDGSGIRNHSSGVFLISNSTSIDGLTIRNSKLSRFSYTFLQSNTTTGNLSNVHVIGNTFEDFATVALLFNAPAAGAYNENITVAFNDLGSNLSKHGLGFGEGYPHRGSFAGHVSYTRLIGNHAYGDGSELFRAEEAVKVSAWVGNTAKLNGRDGIEIIPNNAGGTLYTPTLFSIGHNVIDHIGLSSAAQEGAGLHFKVYDTVTGLEDAEGLSESSITSNVVAGFKQGIWLDQGLHRSIVSQNVTLGKITSDVGIHTKAPSAAHRNNMITDHDTSIQFERGGILGPQHFRWTSGSGTAVISVTSGIGVMLGWDWESGRESYANGTTEVELITIGDKIDGRLSMSLQNDDGSRYHIMTGRIYWNGTSMSFVKDSVGDTRTNNVLFADSTIGVKNGNLTVAIYNGSGASVDNMRLQVVFEGRHEWS